MGSAMRPESGRAKNTMVMSDSGRPRESMKLNEAR